MCITAPAKVIAVDADGAIVELVGAWRRASTVVVPDVGVGDWVMVGAGTILRRLDPADAIELAREISSAIAAHDGADADAHPRIDRGGNP